MSAKKKTARTATRRKVSRVRTKTLSISLPPDLRARIVEAARAERRTVSNWVLIRLETYLESLERSRPFLRVAEEGTESYARSAGK